LSAAGRVNGNQLIVITYAYDTCSRVANVYNYITYMYIMKDKVFDLELNTIEKHDLEKKIVDTITEITSSRFRVRRKFNNLQ